MNDVAEFFVFMFSFFCMCVAGMAVLAAMVAAVVLSCIYVHPALAGAIIVSIVGYGMWLGVRQH